MTARGGYLTALVVAVVALVGSVIAVFAFTTTSGPWAMHREAQASSADGWRQGLAGGGFMGDGGAGRDEFRGMMGGSGGGMMGNWDDNTTATVSPAQARTAADQWVAANQPGATLGQGAQMPMGYIFTVTKAGQTVGMLVVNDDSGAVSWVESTGPAPASSAS
jgi:hypothetical protein